MSGDSVRDVLTQLQPDELITDVERAMLGGVLIDPAWLPPLKPEEFYIERHRIIWRTMLELADKGMRPDLVTTVTALKQSGLAEEAGGPQYLALLVADGPPNVYIDQYAQQVRDAATSRSLRSYGATLVGRNGMTPDQAIAEIAQMPRPMRVVRFDALALWREVQQGWQKSAVFFGLVGVDQRIGGLYPGDLAIVAGRYSHGKTSLLISAVIRWLAESRSVSYLSLETSAAGILRRLIGAKTKTRLLELRRGSMGATSFELADEAAAWLASAPLRIADTSAIGGKGARSVLDAVATDASSIVVIDHVQEVKTLGDSRAQALGEFVGSLKEIGARDEKLALLAAQLNRGAEARPDKLPIAADLKDTGGLEEKGDVILLLHYWMKAGDRKRGEEELEAIIAKNRDGPTGRTTVRFQAQYGLVSDPLPEKGEPSWIRE